MKGKANSTRLEHSLNSSTSVQKIGLTLAAAVFDIFVASFRAAPATDWFRRLNSELCFEQVRREHREEFADLNGILAGRWFQCTPSHLDQHENNA